MTKFAYAMNVKNEDLDLHLIDITEGLQDGLWSIDKLMDEAIALKAGEVIHIVGNKVPSSRLAMQLNEEYQKLVLDTESVSAQNVSKTNGESSMKNTSVEVAVIEEVVAKEEVKGAVSSAARDFLNRQGAAMQNAKKAPASKVAPKVNNAPQYKAPEYKAPSKTNNEGESTMTNTLTVGAEQKKRREIAAASALAAKNNPEASDGLSGLSSEPETATKGTRSSREFREDAFEKSNADSPIEFSPSANESGGNASTYFRGPWYLNVNKFPALARFEEILETMSDKELGLTNIVVVDPSTTETYGKRGDIADMPLLIEIVTGGIVHDFPIKRNRFNSGLNSTSIGHKTTGAGRIPIFGFSRPNAVVVKATCGCGNEFEANTGNMYCFKCRTRHDDLTTNISVDKKVQKKHTALAEIMKLAAANEVDTMTMDPEALEHFIQWANKQKSVMDAVLADSKANMKTVSDIKADAWVFQEISNVKIPQDTLALVMAIAHRQQQLDMHGLIQQ